MIQCRYSQKHNILYNSTKYSKHFPSQTKCLTTSTRYTFYQSIEASGNNGFCSSKSSGIFKSHRVPVNLSQCPLPPFSHLWRSS